MLVPEEESIPGAVLEKLRSAQRLVVLTGAGISAESGVPTFRGDQGLWKNYRPEDLASPAAFARDPTLVWEWYHWRRDVVAGCKPNAAHDVVARLESSYPAFLLVTQNVDGLHRRAGSQKLVEVHGHIFSKRCTQTPSHLDDYPIEATERPLPHCSRCGALARPHIVWFGERLPTEALDRAIEAITHCDALIVVGTSGVVYPVAAFPDAARRAGAYVALINPEPTDIDEEAHALLRGKASTRMLQLATGLGLEP